MKRIAFVVQLPKEVSPGQRFRFELWEPVLMKESFVVETFPFFDEKSYIVLYSKGFFLKKAVGFFKGIFKRIFLIWRLRKYDFIFLQREFAPLGPPVFEWIASKLLKYKIIYDFDDAIWIPNTSSENKIVSVLKATWKVKYICRWAYKVVGGNEYLCEYAQNYNAKVFKVPTCVDTTNNHNKLKIHTRQKPVIGWTGSHSTLKYLDEIVPVLMELRKKFDFSFLIIADKDPSFSGIEYEFIKWNKESEINDLLKIDIGVMPLTMDSWSEGKCGFKIIQYLALGIPAVVSPVGVNKEIIEQGKNGFLCSSAQEWYNAFAALIQQDELRAKMGSAGKEKIGLHYSIHANATAFLALFT